MFILMHVYFRYDYCKQVAIKILKKIFPTARGLIFQFLLVRHKQFHAAFAQLSRRYEIQEVWVAKAAQHLLVSREKHIIRLA